MKKIKEIPVRVRQDAIVDAICEFRVESKVDHFSQVILGVVFTALDGDKAISQSVPTPFPDVRVNGGAIFPFANPSNISWNGYVIHFTDNSFFITCKTPYPRWSEFKAAILNILKNVLNSGLVDRISRYSLKYTDFLPSTSELAFYKFVDLDLMLGGEGLSPRAIDMRIEVMEDDILHLLGILNPALSERNTDSGVERVGGVLVSTDSIVVCSPADHDDLFNELGRNFENALDRLHLANKAFFFKILSDEGLQVLGPVYE